MTDSTTDSGRERSLLVRKTDTARFKKRARALAADLGGPQALNSGQLMLVRAATQIGLELEDMQARRAGGQEVDLREMGMMTDRLGRTLERLGLEPEKVEPPSGVQIVLTEIVNPDGSPYDAGVEPATRVIEHIPATEYNSHAIPDAEPERIPSPPELIEPPRKEPTTTERWYQWSANGGVDGVGRTERILDWSDRRR